MLKLPSQIIDEMFNDFTTYVHQFFMDKAVPLNVAILMLQMLHTRYKISIEDYLTAASNDQGAANGKDSGD